MSYDYLHEINVTSLTFWENLYLLKYYFKNFYLIFYIVIYNIFND